ncbi:jg11809 [Pararge aegeria aegeria]|uniref:Jg11809 protein n=1 Tax=Pararge aegeria aegeria TaxID=348720 RepID=A0A8S4S429_9NEOP|nr:jg11809 [Pararge aegeria aegeria]
MLQCGLGGFDYFGRVGHDQFLNSGLRFKLEEPEGHSSSSRNAEVAICGILSTENRWTWDPIPRCWSGDLASVNAVLVDPRRGDIRRIAGNRWTQAAQSRGIWNSLQKTYVQQ